MLKRDRDDGWLLFGAPLFGFWLPFMGWREMLCDYNGIPLICVDYGVMTPLMLADVLHVEWLGIGFAFVSKNLRPATECMEGVIAEPGR